MAASRSQLTRAQGLGRRRRGRRARSRRHATDRRQRRPLRIPLLAAGISLVFPGFGQALGESFLRSALWLLAWWLAVGVAGDDQLSGAVIAIRVLAAADAFLFVRMRLTRPAPGRVAYRDG